MRCCEWVYDFEVKFVDVNWHIASVFCFFPPLIHGSSPITSVSLRRPNCTFWSTRSEQHYRHHRVHISQRGGPFKKRLKEKQLLVRLVLLLWCPFLHHGGDGGRLGCAHVHRPTSTAANRSACSWLPPRLGHYTDTQLPLPLPAPFPLFFSLHRPIAFPRRLTGGPQGLQRAAIHRDLHVHASPGHPQVHRYAHLQLWEGPQLPSGPQLHPEGPKRLEPHQHSKPPHHPCMRGSAQAREPSWDTGTPVGAARPCRRSWISMFIDIYCWFSFLFLFFPTAWLFHYYCWESLNDSPGPSGAGTGPAVPRAFPVILIWVLFCFILFFPAGLEIQDTQRGGGYFWDKLKRNK